MVPRSPAAGSREYRQDPSHKPIGATRNGWIRNLDHAERIRNQTGMLAAGAAKAVERVARDVVAPLHGNLLDCVGHILDRDPDEAVRDLFGCAFRHRSRPRALRTPLAPPSRRSAGRGSFPKIFGKEVGNELAQHHIGIGHGERPARGDNIWVPDWPRLNRGRRAGRDPSKCKTEPPPRRYLCE